VRGYWSPGGTSKFQSGYVMRPELMASCPNWCAVGRSRGQQRHKRWEQQEAAAINAMISVARERKNALKLDGWSDVPQLLDWHGVHRTVIQRLAGGNVKLDRHQVDDLFHTVVPVAHADVVFLDRKTKSLLKGMNTRSKVFSKREIEVAFQHLETLAAA